MNPRRKLVEVALPLEAINVASARDKERQRLFRIIEELVKWENTTNETVLEQARRRDWRWTCESSLHLHREHPSEPVAAMMSAA